MPRRRAKRSLIAADEFFITFWPDGERPYRWRIVLAPSLIVRLRWALLSQSGFSE